MPTDWEVAACLAPHRRDWFEPMRQRFQLSALLLAWLIATGSQWDLVQVFAWGRMFASYSRIMSVESALRLTFKPDNMCSVCKMVKAAKQQQEQSPVAPSKTLGKILLVFAPVPTVVVASVSSEPWPVESKSMCSAERGAPPIPPPRDFVA
jgi:hypothetical protein